MSQYAVWKKMGLGAALLVAFAAPGALHVVRAAPEKAESPPAKVASNQSFVPVCKAAEVVDSRPDPVWVGQSFANDNCRAPRLPAPIDGLTASREQIEAGMTAVKSYSAQADLYQQCIADFVALRKAKAEGGKKPMETALIMIENHRITASQENKKKADAQIKIAIEAFNELGSECPDWGDQ